MPTRKIIAMHESAMEKTADFLRNELKSVRTGRASPGLVENLSVDYYGSPTPLKSLATIAVPEPSSIVIKPFDPACLKDIEKAIKTSDLSLAPVLDGKMIRLNIPPLSEERRKQIVQQVKQMGEKTKVSIRNIRRDANKQLDDEQKNKTITEDDCKKAKETIDTLTKKFIDEVDSIIKHKSEEIMTN
ncbi:MAG TPA: ribosome recycling factor [Anaerohalosphaeraceae bacterium]|nr:ribosome recycling factor [Phycisphaerae bacterium]HOK94703.1 ribosome recycling factor [Anaerohalosphaeraceae bacterium]HOL30579.1 ribosome recycling factor [Anaerohalosphaeraceae bacterium]HOM76433.1 ribosome recycling factor [Anaerohalosphaeraceae bacterium]HPC63600.1 ribosome recycling factor [Anaerohalosphaeraceae bacterium]